VGMGPRHNIADDEPSPANSLFRQPMTLTEWLATWLQGQLALARIRREEITGEITVINDVDGGRWR